MKKLDFNKWIHLDKKFIISLICQCLLGPFFFIVFWLLESFAANNDSFYKEPSNLKICFIVVVICFSVMFILDIVNRYVRIARIVESTLNDIEKMPEEEVTENLKFLINIMIKDEETRNRKLKEIEDFTKKEDSVAELYTWIRRTQYVS